MAICGRAQARGFADDIGKRTGWTEPVLWLKGEDLRPLPLEARRARLRRLLRRRSNHLIAEAMTIDGRGKALMAALFLVRSETVA